MRTIQKPPWLIFSKERREWSASHRISKGGKREEDLMYHDFRKACDEMGYEGNLREWFYLMEWRRRR